MRIPVQSLAPLSGLKIWRCLELWCSLDPTLLWLWHRMEATTPIRPLPGNFHMPHLGHWRKKKEWKTPSQANTKTIGRRRERDILSLWRLPGFISHLPNTPPFSFTFLGLHMACTSSQAKGQIRTAAASLCHSPSNARSEPCLQPTPQLNAMLDPSPSEQGQRSNLCPRGY